MIELRRTLAAACAVAALCCFSPLRAETPVADGAPAQEGAKPDAAIESDPHAGHAHGAGMHEDEPQGDAAAETKVRRFPWSEEALQTAASLPIQEGGRIKPLSTYASFTLLRLNGKRSVTLADGTKLGPVEWLLDTLFFPAAAARYPIFLVQNDEVVKAIGLSLAGKKKRDRYSFEELRPHLTQLFQHAHEYSSIEEKNRSTVQQQIVNLTENVHSLLQINGHETLSIVPPTESVALSPEWFTLADLFARMERGDVLPQAHTEILERYTAMAGGRDDAALFERELTGLHTAIVKLADARGEYGKVGMEISYYKADYLTWSLGFFVLAFLSMAFMWLFPKNRMLHRVTTACAIGGTSLVVIAIVVRCIIRGRPPVSTLYETVLFVTAVGAIVALFTEAINRQRIAVSAAAILGTVGLFIANGYETLDKKDTMPSLVAVLDTNFWLATHVTAITIGYSAGMLAALLASLYLVAKAVGWKRGDATFYRSLGRMVYGVICFGLIFGTVGTILGGIWANESWGRFWGWDPKENGALLIVLTEIVILHARMGGYLREHGVCMAAALLGTVVAFSWWGVNLLGVGLHSYGFTSGIHTALWTYYGIQWSIVALGGFAWWTERVRMHAAAGAAAPDRAAELAPVPAPEPIAVATNTSGRTQTV